MFPADDASTLEHLLFRQSAILSRTQALEYFTTKQIRHRLAAGRWRRAHRAVYVTHTGPLDRAQQRWIAVLGSGDGAYLAGLSALEVLGLRGYFRRPLHVLLPAPRRDPDPPAGVVVHRSSRLPSEDLLPRGRPPCTMAARSLVDAAAWAVDDDEARAIIAAGFQQRLVGAVDMDPVLARSPRVRRRALIVEAVRDASGGSESITELEVLRLCRRGGLPEPSRQAARYDTSGRKRYRDIYFERWRVQVEVDGRQHTEVRAWAADMRQQNELTIAGVRLLRFPAWMVRHQPGVVVDQIRAALHAAGWRL